MQNNYGGIPIKKEYKPYLDVKSTNDRKSRKEKVNNRRKRKNNNWIWNLLLVFFLVVTGFGVYELFNWHKDNLNTSEMIEEIGSTVVVEEVEDNESTEIIGTPVVDEEVSEEIEEEEEPEVLSDYWYYVQFPLIDVDITALKNKNKDTIGWINVNNTNINYPFVQTTDNKYYLTHSYDKSYNTAGWVFMDYRNNSDLNNRNTILYAHSRLDKTMFGSLSKTLKYNWYSNKDNHIIRISTETENTLWQIFSVYKIEEESYYITTNFSSDEKYIEFLNTIASRSLYNFNTNLTESDQILTLSTCYSDTERTVVHAKLIKRSVKD